MMLSRPPARSVELLDAAPAMLGWLAQSLAARGHVVRHRPAGGQPEAGHASQAADLVVAYRPRWDGSTAAWLQALRLASGGACVIATGPGDMPGDRVAFLEAGADDCLHLGLPRAEILARLDAALRRLPAPAPVAASAAVGSSAPQGSLLAGGWRLVPGQRHLLHDDGRAPLRLTSAEYTFLRVLAEAGGAAVDRDVISRAVFRRPWRIEDRAVDSLVKRVRRKLGADPIASVRGVGYSLLLHSFSHSVKTELEGAEAGAGSGLPAPGRESAAPTTNINSK